MTRLKYIEIALQTGYNSASFDQIESKVGRLKRRPREALVSIKNKLDRTSLRSSSNAKTK